MKGFFIVILCALFIFLAIQFFGSKDKKSYVERTFDGFQKAKTELNVANVRPIKSALLLYRATNGSYPNKLSDLVPEFLTSKRQILDSWGNEFKLIKQGMDSLVLISTGIDGVLGTDDDIKYPI